MANQPNSEKEALAWEFAKELHKNQIRKFINLPYFDAHVQKDSKLIQIVSKFNLNIIKTGQFKTGDLTDEYIILKK